MMLKPSIDKLLDKVPSRYSLVILQAKRAHELAAGAEPTQEFSSVKYTLQALEEIESGNVIIHPNPEAKRKLARLKVIQARLAAEEEERKIKEQIAKDKEEGDKILQLSFLDAGDAVLLRVEDNGMGMRKEVLENILKDNNKVPKHGSGVGVINVHSRIQLMFGEQYGLEIYSEPDEGTRVVIHIPAIPYTKENAEQLEMQKYIQGRDVDEKE